MNSPKMVPTSSSDRPQTRSETSIEPKCRNRLECNSNNICNGNNISGKSFSNNNQNRLEESNSCSFGSPNAATTLHVKANHNCNNASSHHNTNSKLKSTSSPLHVQKSKSHPQTNHDDNANDHVSSAENIREISRFSPTPTPYVDFPLQFNFGSTYASSVTVFFDT